MRRFKGSIVSSLAPFVVMGVMGWLAFTRPQVFGQVIGSAIAVGFGVIVLAVVLVGWALISPGSAQRLRLQVKPTPGTTFVGMQGTGVGLRMTDQPDGSMRVEGSRGNYIFIFVLLAMFGPGLIALQIWNPGLFHTHGWLLPSLVVWFVELGVTALFVRAVYQYAIARHAMVISADAIVMLAGRHVAGRFTRAEFASVRVDTLSYTSTDEGSHQSHENFVLVARMAAGGEERFCISDHRAQIEQIAAAIHDRMGVPLGT